MRKSGYLSKLWKKRKSVFVIVTNPVPRFISLQKYREYAVFSKILNI